MGIPYSQPSLVFKTILPSWRESWSPVLINISNSSNIKLRSLAFQETDSIGTSQNPRKCDTLLSYLVFVPSPEPADVQFLLGRRGRTS